MARDQLYRGQPGTSSAAAYTSTNQRTTITAASVCNPTASAAELSVWRVPNGGSAVDANKIYDALSVPANSQVGLPLLVAKTMAKDEELHLMSSTASALTVDVDGDVQG